MTERDEIRAREVAQLRAMQQRIEEMLPGKGIRTRLRRIKALRRKYGDNEDERPAQERQDGHTPSC
ncbi:MAG TPA: hypothetical protein VFA10_08950 [Ktedonobacteraceae bacterium]|nr:hypothetical protein [Ktedonobacteraceae bacterium]